MSSVRSILSAMHLPKTLWDELIKTVAYLKNRSPGINGITAYELSNHVRPNLSHLKVVGSRAWVHIPKEKRVKLDVRSWQGIFIGYEGKNHYRVYNPRTGYRVRKTLTRTCALPANTLILESVSDL